MEYMAIMNYGARKRRKARNAARLRRRLQRLAARVVQAEHEAKLAATTSSRSSR